MTQDQVNIAELLKDCPKGMKLYSPLCGECTLYDVNDYNIRISTPNKDTLICLYHDGRYCANGEIMLFPKGKTTWDGFVPPCQFKDGDILATDLGSVFFLNTRLNTDECYGCYVGIGGDGSFHICEPFAYKECCGLATEEEKETLFQAIKENGYTWNEETKTLEELVKPKFKVGDRIRNKHINNGTDVIIDIEGNWYVLSYCDQIYLNFKCQDNYELVPNKFDITNLKPFDKVLVRDTDAQEWTISLFSHCNGLETYKYSCINNTGYAYCIPYEENKHLLGKTDDCDEFYKNW